MLCNTQGVLVFHPGLLADPAVKAFGLEIETQLSRVPARVLNPPMLAYGSPEALTPGTRVSMKRNVLCMLAALHESSQPVGTIRP